MKIVSALLSWILIVSLAGSVPARRGSRKSRGSLILAGAQNSRASFGSGVLERFVSLAGGEDATFVYIPTAALEIKTDSGLSYRPSDNDIASANSKEFEKQLCKEFKVKHITILHTRNRKTASTEAFVCVLRRANGVWLSGGNSGRLRNAYLGTLTQREIKAVIDRGGVVGGNSAGAMILASFVLRGRSDKPVLMARGHESGFGFVRNVVIDPHVVSSKREEELINVLDRHPRLLGIGVDDRAAILIQGNRVELSAKARSPSMMILNTAISGITGLIRGLPSICAKRSREVSFLTAHNLRTLANASIVLVFSFSPLQFWTAGK